MSVTVALVNAGKIANVVADVNFERGSDRERGGE